LTGGGIAPGGAGGVEPVATPAPDPLAAPPTGPPVASIDDAIARMQQIDAALPVGDGLACFNRMYLEVTQQVQERMTQGFFSDPAFLGHLDVVFANIYFAAVNAVVEQPTNLPAAWAPLLQSRRDAGIFPIQFALAGMNAHINHDLPLAVVQTCRDLGVAPDQGSIRADYQKVDALLDAADEAVRQSFESSGVQDADRRVEAVINLIGNWSINSARDVAWDTALGLWECRSIAAVEDLLMNGLARTVAMASRCLLVAY
jgi:hypothetical protein